MKTSVKSKPYAQVLELMATKHRAPKRPNILFRTLLKIVSAPDLIATRFSCRKIGMEQLGKNEPCLFLMNHSSFVDLEIAASILFPRAFNIVTTADAFVGKSWLMRQIGCIPTNKFVTDTRLVRDMRFALKENNSSVLMYPEASYSFDGTATPLPESLGKCIKLLGVPVVMIRTYGAFSRDPLYNGLQRRKVKVSADMTYLLSPEEIAEKTPEELNAILAEQFSFDNFRWQQEHNVRVAETFRADGLNRVLYKCPHCYTEGQMTGKGVRVACGHCGKSYTLTEYGTLEAEGHEAAFDHVPDWYRWERECVRKELTDGSYRLEAPVDILMLSGKYRLYRVGEGSLTHTAEGFHLTGCDGQIDYVQKPAASYSLYSDYYWYELGDMICVGNQKVQYYCFPKDAGDVVAKTRLATEELYKLSRSRRAEMA